MQSGAVVPENIQAMTSSMAWRRVLKRCPCSRSTFNDLNSVSLQALSQQSPRRLIDAVMPYVVSTSRQSLLAYWLPRSLWKINPASLLGWRLNHAMRSASMTISRVMSARRRVERRVWRSCSRRRANAPTCSGLWRRPKPGSRSSTERFARTLFFPGSGPLPWFRHGGPSGSISEDDLRSARVRNQNRYLRGGGRGFPRGS